MDVILNVLGFLGVGAVLIALYVFTSGGTRRGPTARPEVPEAVPTPPTDRDRLRVVRSREDRRNLQIAPVFPMLVDGILVTNDRRAGQDRRASA